MAVLVVPLNSSAALTRLLVADDSANLRDGLCELIGSQADLELIAEATDEQMALELAQSLHPEIIVVAARLFAHREAEVIQKLARLCAGVIVLVSDADDEIDLRGALQAGARGYLSQTAPPLEMLSAIRTVARGGLALGQSETASRVGAAQAVATEPSLSARDAFHELTDREFEVLEWLAVKRRNREIASMLGISEKTVRNHVSNIVWKLQAKDRDAVRLKARKAGLGRVTVQQGAQDQGHSVNKFVGADPTGWVEATLSQPLLGREREWLQLEMAWAAGLFIYITGPEGVGKTRLMREFAASRGGLFIEFEGRPGDASIPYASYARSIRKLRDRFPGVTYEPWIIEELQRIVPSLGSGNPLRQARHGPEATVRLCEAIATFHVTLAQQMTGILVDDIEYFDQASAEASIFMISNWERFGGNLGEAQHFIACFRAGRLRAEIEAGIRQQARAGTVALIELAPLGSYESPSSRVEDRERLN